MYLQNMNRDDLQHIVNQLDQALHHHTQWHKELLRTIACRLLSDEHDEADEPHKQCRFGQWYYSKHPEVLDKHSGFIAIGEAHMQMHKLAKHMLEQLAINNKVNPVDYDFFANSLERLRFEIYSLKNELEGLLINRDPLTNAINRIHMLSMLREQQELVKRQYQPCCLVMVDLDHFKNVNDKYGHVVGDKVLATVAAYLIDHLRSYDKIFRYGGEEFLILLQQMDIIQASSLIERMREGVAALVMDDGNKQPIKITFSAGLAPLEANISIEDSINNADKALYMAKKMRNCTQVWPSEVH